MWLYGKKSIGSIIFDIFNIIFLTFLSITTVYPFLYVVLASFSDPMRLMAHRGILLRTIGFTLKGYELVFKNNTIVNGYLVTIFLVVVGTTCNLIMTVLFAYVLSRRGMLWHKPLTVMVVITMYFNGGMIPSYIVVRTLGLIDSLWALILPGVINTYNMIIMRTAFRTIPFELEESARLDGAGELRLLASVIIPMSTPTIAAIGLFYAVGHWNSWANALIYIKTPEKYPLQLVLRSILIQGSMGSMLSGEARYQAGQEEAARMLLKYSTVVVSIVPIMCVYPFLQKYFTQGIMIGALKG